MSIESRSRKCGTIFDHWRIYELLGTGSGGNSAVFRLVHTASDSVQSALKVVSLIEERGNPANFAPGRLQEYHARKERCKANAAQEVLLMNDLHGRTNIVGYLDHTFREWQDETGFGCDMLIRMELLKDLRSTLITGRLFPEAEVLKLGRDICTALDICHSKHIMHRDIKPENIFFNADGNYKLGDFGISRILSALPSSKATTGVGTPQYWAPEQPYGNYDITVDIYSLGLVLYELSNGGKLPFADSAYVSEEAIQLRMMGHPLPAPANASPALASVILKACAFYPADRYQSASAFLADLNRLSAGPAVFVNAPAPASAASGYTTPQNPGLYNQTPPTETVSVFSAPVHHTTPVRPNPYTTPAPMGQPYISTPAQSAANPYVTTPAQPVANPYATTPAQPVANPYATTPAQPAANPYVTTPARQIVDPYATSPAQPDFIGGYAPFPHNPPQAAVPAPEQKESGSKLVLIVRTVVTTALILLVLGTAIFFISRLRDSDSPRSTEPQQLQTDASTVPSQQPVQPTMVPATAPQEVTEALTEPTERKLPTDHPYYSCYDPNTEFVLPYSNTYYYAPTELANLSDKQLEVAKAELYARYGQLPADKDLADYFTYMSWFLASDVEASLNDCEWSNLLLISTVQKKRSGTLHYSSSQFMVCYDPDVDYILDSNLRYLGSEDLEDLSREALVLARNEIFARHGYIFLADDLMEYFYTKDWYVPRYLPSEFSYSLFSETELANISLLNLYDQLYSYSGPYKDNPYVDYLTPSGFILPQSGSFLLTEDDLAGLTDTELLLAESEIYARHGLAFEDTHLLHYFMECPWYSVEVAPNHSKLVRLSSIEKANVELIQKYRQTH